MIRNTYLKIVLLFFTIAAASTLFAQGTKINITGSVLDVKNEPLVGASIVIEGTTLGTIADYDGNFSISVEAGKNLVFSYSGFKKQIIKIKASDSKLKVVLEEDANILKDVVVYGYGTVQRKDLTGSIESLKTDDLVKSMSTNVSEALNGRVAGVLVSKSSNRPGDDMSIQIRGKNSINVSNEPLYVIDGVPSSVGMRHLNSADIESIDILKDASSSAIYGSRGANGVVIVTTKGANKKDGFSINYDGSVGFKTATRIPDMIGNKGNGLEYVDYKTALWIKKYGEASLSRDDFFTKDEKRRIKHGEYYDWLREVSETALVTNHSLSASGSSTNTSYTMGIGYTNDGGMVGNENFERITANLGLEHRLSDKFKVVMTAYMSLNNRNHGANDALLNAYFLAPTASPYGADGNYTFEPMPTSARVSPFFQMDENKRETKSRYTNFSGYLQYSPIKGLDFKTQASVQYDNDVYGEWIGSYTQAKQGASEPDAFRREGVNYNYVWDNTVTFDKTFNNVHKINAVGLFSLFKETHQGSQMRGIGMPYESDWHAIGTADQQIDVNSYYWESSMISYMARLNYVFKDRYLFTATGRYDGSSKLAKGNQWAFMPSFAGAWRISEEEFMASTKDWLSNFKLRVGWGRSGNGNNMSHNMSYSSLNLNKYPFGSTGANGFGMPDDKGNPALKWEMTSEWNYGLNLGFLNSRINLTFDYYDRRTKDLILKRGVSAINGYRSLYQNIGEVSNKGFEVGINSVNVQTKDFSWKTDLTLSTNKNEIVDLYGDKKDDLGNRWFIGQSINSKYDFVHLGIWQEEERAEAAKYSQVPGHIKVEDRNTDGQLDERDFTIIGKSDPAVTLGLNNSFTYKNFDLSVFMYGRFGGLYNDQFTFWFTALDNEHWNRLDANYWTPENRSNDYPQVGAQSYHTQVLGYISGTFLKIQNITLGYTLPTKLVKSAGISSLRVYGNVLNPFTFSSYKGPDPEIIGENIYSQLSLYPMTFSFGVNLAF